MQTAHAQVTLTAPTGIAAAAAVGDALVENVSKIILGKPEVIRLAVVALLSGGHLLLEDVPGRGKTLLAKAMAHSVGGSFRRIQGTPDLLPSELTGVSVFQPASGTWSFRPGPLFANVVMLDEVNRVTPRTQSALLEAMEEGHVTADGHTHPLPQPFFVVATQNPYEYAGTFPLVEGQRDRFTMVLELGHPPRSAERALLAGEGGADRLERAFGVVGIQEVAAARAAVQQVHSTPQILEYVIDIGHATRSDPDVVLGASPRATLGLLAAAKAHAVLAGRHYVLPDDVQALAPAVLSHRLILAGGTGLGPASAVVRRILDIVTVP